MSEARAGLNALGRRGWTRDLLKVGDTVKVIACPARGGAPVASAREVVLNGGRKMVGSPSYDGGPVPRSARRGGLDASAPSWV